MTGGAEKVRGSFKARQGTVSNPKEKKIKSGKKRKKTETSLNSKKGKLGLCRCRQMRKKGCESMAGVVAQKGEIREAEKKSRRRLQRIQTQK